MQQIRKSIKSVSATKASAQRVTKSAQRVELLPRPISDRERVDIFKQKKNAQTITSN